MQARLYLIHLCRVWSQTSTFSISRFANFTLSTLITSNAVYLSFLLDKSQKRLSIFILIHILAFCITSFSFLFLIFSKSIFIMEIPRAIIPYYFCINLAYFPKLLSNYYYLSTSQLLLYLLSVLQNFHLVEFTLPRVLLWWYYFP